MNTCDAKLKKNVNLKDDPLVLLGWSCPYCGNPTKLVEDSRIYGRSYGAKCYICEPCGAWVGCHKGTDKALGRIANKELRELKHQAHEAFDPLWKEGYLPRTSAYEVLSVAFGLPKEQTHIGMFDEGMCRKVIALSNIILKYLSSEPDRKINPQSDVDLLRRSQDALVPGLVGQISGTGRPDH